MKSNKRRLQKIKKDQRKKDSGLIFTMLLIFIFQFGTILEYFDAELKKNDLIKFKGEVISFKETRIGGTRSYPAIFYQLKNNENTFQISGASYKIMDIPKVKQHLRLGNIIEVGSSKEELIEATSVKFIDRILNRIIGTRKNLQTFYFKKSDQQLFNLKRYNEIDRKRKRKNVITVVILSLVEVFIFGALIYAIRKS